MEKISETISVMEDSVGWYYWVRVKSDNNQLTGKVYQDKDKCIEDAKKLDLEKNPID